MGAFLDVQRSALRAFLDVPRSAVRAFSFAQARTCGRHPECTGHRGARHWRAHARSYWTFACVTNATIRLNVSLPDLEVPLTR